MEELMSFFDLDTRGASIRVISVIFVSLIRAAEQGTTINGIQCLGTSVPKSGKLVLLRLLEVLRRAA